MINAFISLGFEVFVLNRIRNYFLFRELSSCMNEYNKHLPLKLKTRIKSYTRIASLPNLWFSELRGYPLSRDEILANRYLGASTPLFDDLLDHEGYSYREVLEAIGNDKENKNESLVLLKYLNANISPGIKNPELFRHYLQKTAEAQKMSTRQKDNSNLTTEEIRDITYKKGGYATLLYRSVLANELLPGEEEAIYHLGALLQMMNDIFDVYEDHKNEQQTLATVARDIGLLKHEYDGLTEKTLRLFRNVEYQHEKIEKALQKIIPVISRGCVCLEQLLALQGGNKAVFDTGHYTRRELLCDMEKISNIRRSMVISRKIAKGQLPF